MENIKKSGVGNGIFQDAFILTVSTLITKIIGVGFKIPLSYILGDEGLGYFNTAYSIYVFFYALCTAGVPKAITLTLTRECDNSLQKTAITKRAIRLFAIIGLAISMLMLLLSPMITRIVKNERVIIPLVFIIPSLVFVSVSGVIRGYLASVNKMTSIAISQLIEAAFKLVIGLALALCAIKLSLPLYYISGFAILGVSLGCVASCIYLYAVLPRETIRENDYPTVNKGDGIIKNILKIAIPISISASVINFASLIDMGLIMRGLQGVGYTSAEATALYGNYSTLVVPMLNLVISLITPFTVAGLARLSGLYFKNKITEYTEQLNELVSVIMFFASHAIVVLMLYSNEILDLLFSSSSSAIASPLLSCLAPGFLFLCVMTVLNTAIEATGDVKTPLVALIAVTLIKSIASSGLILNGKVGAYAIPIGTVIAYFLGMIISVLRLAALGIRQKYLAGILGFALTSVFSVAVSHTLIYYLLPLPLCAFSFIVSIAASTLLYILMNAFLYRSTGLELKKVIFNKKLYSNL